MKYICFIFAVLGIVPSAMILACDRALMRLAMLGLIIPLLMFNSSAINFFSKEFYRGTSRGMEISIIYIVAVIILLALSLRNGRLVNLFPDWGSRIYLLYFAWSLNSLQNAGSMSVSFFELWKMVMIYLVFLAVYHYLEFSNGDFDIILYGIGIVVGVNFLMIVYQHLIGIYQVRGVFPHQNSLAMYMLVVSLIFFSRYFNNVEGWRSRLFFLLFALSSATLIRTYSRGAIACFPLAALMTLLCSIRWHLTMRKLYIMASLTIIGAIGVSAFMPRIIERFEKAPESSGRTRKNLAIAAVNMIQDVPIAGVGVNNWGIKINPPYTYSTHREGGRYNDEFKDGIVETVYLLVCAECGIPGLVLFLSWFGFYFISSFRLLKRLRNTQYYYLPAGILGGMGGILLQSCLEWVLKQQINFMLMMIVFACISYLNRHYRNLIEAAEQPVPAGEKA